jgi:hypothetical protein
MDMGYLYSTVHICAFCVQFASYSLSVMSYILERYLPSTRLIVGGHNATNQQVAGSIPDGITRIFQ